MIRAAQILTLTAALLGAVAFASGCGKATDATDSESHFLTFCTGECGDGLSCVCGVCTRTCDDDAACQGVAFGARCAPLAVSSCAATSGELACDLECSTDSDCGNVGGNHECLSGRCRARQDGRSARVEIDAGMVLSQPEDNRPVVLPELTVSCCPGVSLAWSGYGLDANCRFSRQGVPDDLCESQLPTSCNGETWIDGNDILTALSHPDMTALILRQRDNQPIATYGWNGGITVVPPDGVSGDFDSFPVTEGFYFLVHPYDCTEIVNERRAPPECVSMPAGVRAFIELRDTLLMQQLSLGTCAPDLGCYEPLEPFAPCEPLASFSYDVTAGACVDIANCAEGGNRFESLLACDQACSNDPCARGEPITDEACNGVISRPLAAPLSPRCFANATRACICACAQTGNSLDSCIIQQGAQPEAVCGP